ncbi:hypothetical protein ZIOFF_001805 [Zingiber officinale]|uniref:Uncharacterized protein n=1 Tax=Zingiber officinale TaxID=94328 RepID=A0A8J5HVX0_ZINOF|nr:hypothetical protein ZIOFF_001805 [Zingiber officinale]
MASNGRSAEAGNAESSLEKIKRQLTSGSGKYLLQGPLLKRSETVRPLTYPSSQKLGSNISYCYPVIIVIYVIEIVNDLCSPIVDQLRKWNERWVILDPTTGKMEYKIRRNEPGIKGTIMFDSNSVITNSPINFHGLPKYDGCCFCIHNHSLCYFYESVFVLIWTFRQNIQFFLVEGSETYRVPQLLLTLWCTYALLRCSHPAV